MRKEAVVAKFEALIRHFHLENKENHEKKKIPGMYHLDIPERVECYPPDRVWDSCYQSVHSFLFFSFHSFLPVSSKTREYKSMGHICSVLCRCWIQNISLALGRGISKRGLQRDEQNTRENCRKRDVIVFTFRLVLLGWLVHRAWEGFVVQQTYWNEK